jgi:hypothetical protein
MKRQKEEHSRQLRPLLPVPTGKLYDPLRIVKDKLDPATSRDGAHQKKTTDKPTPIVLTSRVNLLSFRKEINRLLRSQFSLRTTAAAVRIVSHSTRMDHYKVLLSYLSQNTLHNFAFHPKSDKPVKVAIGHLSKNTTLSPSRRLTLTS